MSEVHWTDPEFQKWERSRVGKRVERPSLLGLIRFTYQPGEECELAALSGFQGPMLSFKTDTTPSLDGPMTVDLSEIPEEELRDAVW